MSILKFHGIVVLLLSTLFMSGCGFSERTASSMNESDAANLEITEEDQRLLNLLNARGKTFYLSSKATRNGLEDDDPYKNFLLSGINLSMMDEDGYFHVKPNNWFVPRRSMYPNVDFPVDIPDFFFRYVKDCATNSTTHRFVVDTSLGYANYVGISRRLQQCEMDGSFDSYYVESVTPLE